MKREEIILFKELCKFRSTNINLDLIEAASPNVLGKLFFNRMQGVAYGVLKEHELLYKINREFRNCLKVAYEKNIEKNESYFKCIDYVTNILSDFQGQFAMLKGAFLCGYYPKGYRVSNDIDLLVLPSKVTEIGERLSKAGFVQGTIKNDEFIPASRKEIIESRMTRGETVPYIKEINMPGMKYLEVDINFSLDYKNGEEDIIERLLKNGCFIAEKNLFTLSKEDFIIHLCTHLYKEATTLPWIKMKRDMTLYKYCDIYLLLNEMNDEEIIGVLARAKELGKQEECAYAISQTIELFDMQIPRIKYIVNKILQDVPEFCEKVVDPKGKKILVYKTIDVNKRFFLEDREKDLKEVN